MSDCLFNSCCYYIDLRSGCLVISYLTLIGETIFMVLSLVALIIGSYFALHGEDDQTKVLGIVFVVLGIILLLALLCLFIFNIVLLIGIHKNRPSFVKAGMTVGVIYMVLFSILNVVSCFAVHTSWTGIASRIFFSVVFVYFLLIIRSFYYQMDHKDGPALRDFLREIVHRTRHDFSSAPKRDLIV